MATTYVVLRRAEDSSWSEVKTVYAYSADQAIRLSIDPDGEYLAIPSAKWHYRGPTSGDTLAVHLRSVEES